MKVATYAPSFSVAQRQAPAQPAPAQPETPEDGFSSRKLWAGIAGGTVAAAGLGYLGMNLGMEVGMNAAIGTFGPSAAGQLLSVFVPGLQYMILGAAVGGTLGIATGAAAGGYLGSKLA